MITLLSKLFIKDRENVRDPRVRRSYGILCGFAGIFMNVVLFALKFFAGIAVGSIAIKADAFNNLSDAGSSVITLFGFKFAGAAPDTQHPFGHGRIEYISGFCVSLFIILMGFELGKSSVAKIITPQATDFSVLAIVILACSILAKLYMYFYNRRTGKKIDSPTMLATATDSLSDAVSTFVVLLSSVFTKVTGIEVDGYTGVLVACFILYSGICAAKDTLSPLLGQLPAPELVDAIERTVLAHPEIINIHDLIVHDYGPGRLIISLHGEVAGDGDMMELHDVIDLIEHELSTKFGCIAVIHMDPISVNDEKIVAKRTALASIASSIDERLTIHDFRMVEGPTHTNLIFDLVVPQQFALSNDDVRIKMSELVRGKWPECVCVINVDKPYI